MAEGEQVGHDVRGLFPESVLYQLCYLSEADDGVRVLPVDLIVGQGSIVAGVKDEVLLEKYDKSVLDLPSVQVGSAGDGCETLPSMAREDRVYPLSVVRTMAMNAPVACLEWNVSTRSASYAGIFLGQTYSREFAIDVLNQEGAEFREYLEQCWL